MRASGPASSPTWRSCSASDPLPAVHDRHRPHPLGHPRRAHRPQRPPAPRRRPAGSPSSTTASSRTSPSCAPSSSSAATSCARDTDTEVVAHLLAEELPSRPAATWPRPCDGCAGRCAGAFTLRRRARRRPGRRRRRPPQLPAGGRARRRRELPRPATSRRSSRTPARRSSSARTRSSSCARDARHRHRLRRRAGRGAAVPRRLGRVAPPRRAATTTSCSRRSPSSRGRSPTRCSAGVDADGRLVARRDAAVRRASCATSTRSSSSPAAPRTTPAWSPSTPSSTGPGCPCEVELASEFRYRDPILDRHTLVVAITQSGETMDTLMARAARAGAAARGCWRSATPTARRIPRESDAVLYTHAGPEVAVASTKAFLTQLVAVLPGRRCTSPRCAAPSAATRSRPIVARARGDAGEGRPGAGHRSSRCARWPARCADAKSVLFLGRHVGYPVALEGALKLKELAYMHAEGFAAGELKHGPIALIEEGAARSSSCVPSPRGRSVLHDKIVSATSRRSGPAARARSSSPRRATTRSSPYADHAHPHPGRADAAAAAGRRRCRCRCSPASWPRPRATTSTSRATWPSPSRSSDPDVSARPASSPQVTSAPAWRR